MPTSQIPATEVSMDSTRLESSTGLTQSDSLEGKKMLAQPKKCARAHVSVAKLHHHVTLVRQDIN